MIAGLPLGTTAATEATGEMAEDGEDAPGAMAAGVAVGNEVPSPDPAVVDGTWSGYAAVGAATALYTSI